MSEPKDLLLVNEQLRRSNRRWKALSLAACSLLVVMAVGALAKMQVESERRVAAEARARAVVAAALRAEEAANPGQPR
jgi:hypothetical protein